MSLQHNETYRRSQRQNSIDELRALSARIQRSRERATQKRPRQFFAVALSDVRARPMTKTMLRVRDIGHELYDVGGLDLMRDIYFEAGQPAGIAACWDGLGGWYS